MVKLDEGILCQRRLIRKAYRRFAESWCVFFLGQKKILCLIIICFILASQRGFIFRVNFR
jgi:hypothetical protein